MYFGDLELAVLSTSANMLAIGQINHPETDLVNAPGVSLYMYFGDFELVVLSTPC